MAQFSLSQIGLDRRIISFALLSTILLPGFAVLNTISLEYPDGSYTELTARVIAAHFFAVIAAYASLPWTLPPALAAWVMARAFFSLLRFPSYPSSIFSGAFAGYCCLFGIEEIRSDLESGHGDVPRLLIVLAFAGALSAAIAYGKQRSAT